MKFFKENSDHGQIVPAFPTGNRGIETRENGLEAVHPCVGSLDDSTLAVHFLIEIIFLGRIGTVSSIRTHIGDDSMPDKSYAMDTPVESGIKVAEETVNGNIRILEMPDDFIYPASYLEYVGMVPALRLGHCQRHAVPIAEKKRVGRAPLLSALILNLFTSSVNRSMGTVDMRKRQVYIALVIFEYLDKTGLPFPRHAPFPEVMEDCVTLRGSFSEKMPHRKQPPLIAALELVKNGVDNLCKIIFGGKTSFCY